MTADGRAVTLVSRLWTASAGVGRFGVGASYRTPAAVEVEGAEPVPIRDHVMIARLVAILVTIVALLFGRGHR